MSAAPHHNGGLSGVVIIDLRRRPVKRAARMKVRVKRLARAMLMLAQDGICAHCEKPFSADDGSNEAASPTLDHVLARTLGGSNDISNLLLKHKSCNEAGGSRPPSKRDAKWQRRVAGWMAEAGVASLMDWSAKCGMEGFQ